MPEVKINWDCDITDAYHSPCCKGNKRHDKSTQRLYRTGFFNKEVSLLCADQVERWKQYGWGSAPIPHELACPQCGIMH
jgi:hypothetical protein